MIDKLDVIKGLQLVEASCNPDDVVAEMPALLKRAYSRAHAVCVSNPRIQQLFFQIIGVHLPEVKADLLEKHCWPLRAPAPSTCRRKLILLDRASANRPPTVVEAPEHYGTVPEPSDSECTEDEDDVSLENELKARLDVDLAGVDPVKSAQPYAESVSRDRSCRFICADLSQLEILNERECRWGSFLQLKLKGDHVVGRFADIR